MIDGSRPSAWCAVCGQSLDPAEPNVSVPDLMIEMHKACHRLISKRDFGGAHLRPPRTGPETTQSA
jgi:hypothetical protein